MNIAPIIGRNIEKLREENSISVEALAEIIGVTRQTMTNYIKGKQVIDSGKLSVLANFFNKPFDYFLNETQQAFSFMFRADNPKENFDSSLSERIIRRIISSCDLLEISEKKLSLIPESYKIWMNMKKLGKEEKELIEEIAIKKREAFGIGEIVPDNIYQVFQDNGINVISFPFSNDSIFAVSAYSGEFGCFIVVNDDPGIPEERKIFSVAHEFGHLIFHKGQYTQGINLLYGKKKDINEEIANHFAMCFLVTRQLLKKYKNLFKNKDFLIREILDVKKVLKVSAMCLIYALDYYGYITDRQKGVHIGYLKKKGFGTVEPWPMEGIKKDTAWISMVKELYSREEISLSKICEVLDMPMSHARNFIRELKNEPETIL